MWVLDAVVHSKDDDCMAEEEEYVEGRVSTTASQLNTTPFINPVRTTEHSTTTTSVETLIDLVVSMVSNRLINGMIDG